MLPARARKRCSSARRCCGTVGERVAVSRLQRNSRSGIASSSDQLERRCAAGTSAPPGAQHRVRILPRRQKRKPQRLAGLERRQRPLDQPVTRLQTGRVAVQADDRLVGELPELGELGIADRGPERRDRVGEAGLGERDDVHVAFDHDHRAALADRRPGERQTVEQLALVERRGLRRIEVLRPRRPRGSGRRTRPPARGDPRSGTSRGHGSDRRRDRRSPGRRSGRRPAAGPRCTPPRAGRP